MPLPQYTVPEAAAASSAPGHSSQAAKRQQAASLRDASIAFPVNPALRHVTASLTTDSDKSDSKIVDLGNVRFMIGRRCGRINCALSASVTERQHETREWEIAAETSHVARWGICRLDLDEQ